MKNLHFLLKNLHFLLKNGTWLRDCLCWQEHANDELMSYEQYLHTVMGGATPAGGEPEREGGAGMAGGGDFAPTPKFDQAAGIYIQSPPRLDFQDASEREVACGCRGAAGAGSGGRGGGAGRPGQPRGGEGGRQLD